MRLPGRRLSIGVLVTVTLVVSATTLLAGFGVFSYRVVRQKSWDDLHTLHRQLADSLADALVLPVWNFDHEQIDRIFQGVMENGDVAAVVLRFDDRRQTVVGLARDANGRVHAADLSRAKPGRLHESRDIRIGATRLGTVEVAVNPEFIEARLRDTRLTMIAVVLALDALLVVVPGVLLWRLVLRPLKQIERYAAAVRAGDGPDVRLDEQRFRGEPEQLRSSVEAMMNELLAVQQRHERFEAALATLTRAYVDESGDLPSVLRRVTETCAVALDVTRVTVWRVAGDGRSMTSEDTYDVRDGAHTAGMTLQAKDYPDFFRELADAAAAREMSLWARPHYVTAGYAVSLGIRDFMFVPIRYEGRLVGAFICGHAGGPRVWRADEQTFAVAVANLISALMAQAARQRVEAQLRQAQKLEAIGQLAGGLAHDFNNVLMVILGKAAQIAQALGAPVEVRAAAADIIGSGEHAASLTRQLLAFSRRHAMQTRVLDLNEAVRHTARMLERVLGETVAMHLVLPAAPSFVRADESMLDQVLLNLAVNARDAMPAGGHLTIESSQVDDEALGPCLCLRVSDTGSGIAPEHLPHIFEPFFTTKDVGKGTGLGLAMCYGIVQQHGGRIEVDSESGRGTTFRVLLPLAREAAVPLAVEAAPAAPVGGHETILVVEDETAVRDLVVESLASYGYRLVEAPSGRHALDVWATRADEIDLLVTDMVMPDGLSGFDLAEQLRARRPGLKVLYISGYVAETAGDDSRLAEGVNFLVKPFSLPDLARLIRRTLDATPATRS